jgi:rod shape-determining protein MreC
VVGGQEERRSPRRRIVIYIVLVALSLLLLAMSTSAQVQEVRQGVRYAVSPIQEVLAGGARGVSSIFAAFTEVDQLRRENRSMANELASLRTQVEQLEVVRVENARLSELLEMRRSLDFTTEAAFVVARTPSTFERTVTLDRGRDAGLEIGDAVLSPGGALAGVITEVFEGTASVRLLSDPRSLVIGLAVGTRATGEVVGNFSAPLKLEKVAATETLTEGDTVTTAGTLVKGFKALLPRDLLIGSIVQVTDDPANFSKSALIQPAADLDRLEAVLIITSYDAPVLPVTGETPEPEPEPIASASPGAEPEKTQRPRRNNNRP